MDYLLHYYLHTEVYSSALQIQSELAFHYNHCIPYHGIDSHAIVNNIVANLLLGVLTYFN